MHEYCSISIRSYNEHIATLERTCNRKLEIGQIM